MVHKLLQLVLIVFIMISIHKLVEETPISILIATAMVLASITLWVGGQRKKPMSTQQIADQLRREEKLRAGR